MKIESVNELCKIISPKYNIRPSLMMAICEQESSFDETAVRLENGFYRKYVRPMELPTIVEILLSASYGLTQTIGESLYELKYFSNANDVHLVTDQLEAYMRSPAMQIEMGCKWFSKKLELAKGDISKALLFWNGGANKNYHYEVLEKEKKYAVAT